MIQRILQERLITLLDNMISAKRYDCYLTAGELTDAVCVTLVLPHGAPLQFIHSVHVAIEQTIRQVHKRFHLSLTIIER